MSATAAESAASTSSSSLLVKWPQTGDKCVVTLVDAQNGDKTYNGIVLDISSASSLKVQLSDLRVVDVSRDHVKEVERTSSSACIVA